ncbi:DUF1772 domain-containing protein [Caulobacter sp. BK020]|uniref:DUF1772 domain-containing protein n=1 Tax=Caulobacter sp. BK020 TaxID=2512117 RepID=UPI00104FE401|nr:DUF1772 domain-containing protein [Caulobacter sp. BK020]TCS12322.1 uncharacterized protein DUF1772 [Caulobacter sp. BK020]
MIFPVAALIVATLFTGAALYITLVEHPARLGLGDGPMLAQWRPSYKRALPIQAGLAILGGLFGLVAWCQLADWKWLAGALALVANWPFTWLGVMPTNKRLTAFDIAKAGPESRALLIKWGGLHGVRSLLGVAATMLFGWSLLTP